MHQLALDLVLYGYRWAQSCTKSCIL